MRIWPLKLTSAYLCFLLAVKAVLAAVATEAPLAPPPAPVASSGPGVPVLHVNPLHAPLERPDLEAALCRMFFSHSPCSPRVVEVSSGRYEVEPDFGPPDYREIPMQARIVPAFRDGHAIGFKLFSIRPGSIYSQLGIHNGDTITRINGMDLTTPEKALELYAKLKAAEEIVVDLDRAGTPVRLRYHLTGRSRLEPRGEPERY